MIPRTLDALRSAVARMLVTLRRWRADVAATFAAGDECAPGCPICAARAVEAGE